VGHRTGRRWRDLGPGRGQVLGHDQCICLGGSVLRDGHCYRGGDAYDHLVGDGPSHLRDRLCGVPFNEVRGSSTNGNLSQRWHCQRPATRDLRGELYWGYVSDTTSAVTGSTSGYVYNVNADTTNDGTAYNVNCPGTATFPVWGDAGQLIGIAVLVAEAVAGGRVRPIYPPGRRGPSRYRRPPLDRRPVISTVSGPTSVSLAESGSADDTGLAISAAVPVTESASSTILRCCLRPARGSLGRVSATSRQPSCRAGRDGHQFTVSAQVPLAESGSSAGRWW
jgi:hypothetical protein